MHSPGPLPYDAARHAGTWLCAPAAPAYDAAGNERSAGRSSERAGSIPVLGAAKGRLLSMMAIFSVVARLVVRIGCVLTGRGGGGGFRYKSEMPMPC